MLPTVSFAWGRTAHHIIAEIAYENLTPKARAKADRLVKALTPVYGKSTFDKSSTWADDIRGHSIYAFSSWHYIHQYLSLDDTRPPQVYGKHNIVWAINQAKTVLRSPRANSFEKGMFLRFLIHFISDIHQPLHCVSLVSEHFPDGDNGGNKFHVRHDGEDTNLHAVWDKAGGKLDENINFSRKFYWRSVKKYARKLQKNYPRSIYKRDINQLNPKAWAKEGYRLSKKYVYVINENETLTEDYLARTYQLSEQRMTIAGYRLAKVLNRLFT